MPYVTFDHDQWADLASSTALPLTDRDLTRLSSLGDPISLTEADAIYRPLAAIIQMYAQAQGALFSRAKEFLGFSQTRTPFIVGIAGSVSVGKSTSARLLRELLSRWPGTPHVALVPTDGFLMPNAQLEARGLMGRKGFPESYIPGALTRFLDTIKSGRDAEVPVYDHISYDIVPEETITVSQPDILIVEGLTLLQPAKLDSTGQYAGVYDYFDFTIYLDAPETSLEEWYVDRFLKLRDTAFSDPRSYFTTYAGLSDEQAVSTARDIWRAINLPNLRENIAPTRPRATVILTKGENHRIEKVHLKRI
ncbi:type I pantothenate kinase [Arcanobacterium canis]